jgi:hypothetical protein
LVVCLDWRAVPPGHALHLQLRTLGLQRRHGRRRQQPASQHRLNLHSLRGVAKLPVQGCRRGKQLLHGCVQARRMGCRQRKAVRHLPFF